MVAAIYNLTEDRAIEQKTEYLLTFSYPGNVSNAILKSQIRKSVGGELVGEFRVMGNPVYTESTNKTVFILGLTSTQTDKIPVTTDSQKWLYDLMLRPNPGDQIRLLRGQVEVLPNVTE